MHQCTRPLAKGPHCRRGLTISSPLPVARLTPAARCVPIPSQPSSPTTCTAPGSLRTTGTAPGLASLTTLHRAPPHLAHLAAPEPVRALWPSASPGCPCLEHSVLKPKPLRAREQGSWAGVLLQSAVRSSGCPVCACLRPVTKNVATRPDRRLAPPVAAHIPAACTSSSGTARCLALFLLSSRLSRLWPPAVIRFRSLLVDTSTALHCIACFTG